VQMRLDRPFQMAFPTKPVTLEEVVTQIGKLKNKKAPGEDLIDNKDSFHQSSAIYSPVVLQRLKAESLPKFMEECYYRDDPQAWKATHRS